MIGTFMHGTKFDEHLNALILVKQQALHHFVGSRLFMKVMRSIQDVVRATKLSNSQPIMIDWFF